jgi:hypothetical protein
MAEAQRVDIGFLGGQVVSVRIGDKDLKDLRSQLGAGGSGWHDLQTDEGVVAVDIAKVAFLRVDSGEHRVGFAFGE